MKGNSRSRISTESVVLRLRTIRQQTGHGTEHRSRTVEGSRSLSGHNEPIGGHCNENAKDRTICIAGLALAMLGIVTGAEAQDREGRWEFSLGALYQFSNDLDSQGGSTMDTDSDLGFVTGEGTTSATSWPRTSASSTSIGYDASVVHDEGGRPASRAPTTPGSFSANMIYHLIDGPLTPYVGAGIGWTWIDSNVPSGLP